MEANQEDSICSACFSNSKPVVQKVFRSDREATHCVSQLVSCGNSPELCLGHDGAYYICHQAGGSD